MKYVVLLLVIAGVLFWALRTRQRLSPPRSRRSPAPPAPQAAVMVRCEQCGLHLPRDEALPGAEAGFYCCEDHRRLGPARAR